MLYLIWADNHNCAFFLSLHCYRSLHTLKYLKPSVYRQNQTPNRAVAGVQLIKTAKPERLGSRVQPGPSGEYSEALWWWQFMEYEYMLQLHAHCAWVTTTIKLIIFVAYGAYWVCMCSHNQPNSDMDYRIFIAYTDVNACDCTQGCVDTKRESESWLWEENPLPHWGIEPASVAWRSDALTNWATSHPPVRVSWGHKKKKLTIVYGKLVASP